MGEGPHSPSKVDSYKPLSRMACHTRFCSAIISNRVIMHACAGLKKFAPP